jgi:hypothetical protein
MTTLIGVPTAALMPSHTTPTIRAPNENAVTMKLISESTAPRIGDTTWSLKNEATASIGDHATPSNATPSDSTPADSTGPNREWP